MLIHSIKRNIPAQGETVEAYRNLTNGTFSIRDSKTKLVQCYCESVALTEVELKVSQKSRERAVRDGQRNVHAFVKGRFLKYHVNTQGMKEATYNPFKYETFVDKETEEPIHTARLVVLKDKKMYYC